MGRGGACHPLSPFLLAQNVASWSPKSEIMRCLSKFPFCIIHGLRQFVTISTELAASREKCGAKQRRRNTMKKIGLFIGVDHYDDDAIPDLKCAAHDARELAGMFKHRFGYETEVLTHEELARGRRVNTELRRIRQRLEKDDVFIFFFAGHGKTVSDHMGKSDQLFLLPDVSGAALGSGIAVSLSPNWDLLFGNCL